MSREIKSDLDNLVNFIGAYNLAHLNSDEDFICSIKKQHKKYFAYLVYIAEIQGYVDDNLFQTVFTSNQLLYIKESCSDIGSSFFSRSHDNSSRKFATSLILILLFFFIFLDPFY